MKLLTVREVADFLQCSPEHVRKTFRGQAVDIGTPEDRKKHTGQRRSLRIPVSVVEKYASAKAGVIVLYHAPEPKVSDEDSATRIAAAMLKQQREARAKMFRWVQGLEKNELSR